MTENTYKLIEKAAQSIAEAILLEYGLVKSVDIEVRKPEAPIDMEFGSVSVKINRGWNDVLVAVGSNMGDSRGYIENGLAELENSRYIKDMKRSELIVTKPYGYTDQDDFINGAVRLKTMLSPRGLLDLLHDIENKADRKRIIHWGPRTLDLDILLYDDIRMNDKELTIPHPDMKNREFVLKPLAEIAPHIIP